MNHPFFKLDKRILKKQSELGLTPSELNLYIQVESYNYGNGLPYPTKKTVAKRMGKSPRQIQLASKSLTEKGYLHRTQVEPKSQIWTWDFTGLKNALNGDSPNTEPHLQPFSYPEYLKSPAWASIRARIIKSAGGRCQLCNSSDNIQVHHRTYKRIGHEDDADLIALCADCHVKFHGKEGKK